MKQRNHRTRSGLSAERIVEAALALVDKEGLDGFSFRILAKHLKCEAMSIYHYFPSKTHLFDAMLDSCLSEVGMADSSLPWIEQLRQTAHSWRDMALRHPGFFPFVAVHRLNTRYALGVLDRILKIFEASGREPEWRAKSFRAFGYYLMGALLDETAGYAKGPTTAEPVSDDVLARDFPSVAAAGPFFAERHHRDTFERGLNLHLEQMRRDSGQGANPP